MLAADPTEPRFVALAHRVDGPDFGCSLALSGDRGRTWTAAQPVPRLPKGAEKCYAPEIDFDRRGVLYYLFVGLHTAGNKPMGTFLTTSTDRGRTFSTPRVVLGPSNFAVRMAIDRTLGQSGRIHLVWLQARGEPGLGSLPPTPNPIVAAFSDDGGKKFSKPAQVSDVDRLRVVAPALTLGPDHAVHVAYYDLGDDARDYQGLEGPTWEEPWTLVLATSRDGGVRFQRRGDIIDDEVVPPERVMLIFTMPPPSVVVDDRGRVFVAWHDAKNGDWDAFMRRSTDNGRSWADRVRLNDDAAGNGRHQYQPRLSVSPGGRLDAVFYDRRTDPSNVANHVFSTYSVDGGRTFAENVRLTTRPSSSRLGGRYAGPAAAGLVEFGSRLALLSRPEELLAAWTDTRNGVASPHQDVFAAAVEFSPAASAGGGEGVFAAVLFATIAAGSAVAWRRRRCRRGSIPPSGSQVP